MNKYNHKDVKTFFIEIRDKATDGSLYAVTQDGEIYYVGYVSPSRLMRDQINETNS